MGKSGRFWKSERDRFRSVIRSNKGLKSKQMKNYKNERENRTRIKAYEQSLKDAVKKEKEDLRLRQEANKKQREENARKSEVYQEPGKIEENEEEAVANGCKERRFENAGLICFPLQSF